MSSSSSVNTLQRLVEQLKLEAGVERIRTHLSCAVGEVATESSYGWFCGKCARPACHFPVLAVDEGLTLPGLSGSCRASAVLYAERLQRCFACRTSSWKQPISRAQILCIALKTGKVY